MKKLLLGPLAFLCMSVTSSAAIAAGEGTAVGVNPAATAKLQVVERTLQVGADVSVGELISTGSQGQVQIIFDDGTRLVVGSNSQLLIETYLLASSNTAQKLTVNALGGTFRFITGNSPKPAYSVKTPTASIAVRGTEFDFVVGRGSTQVMLYSGAVEVCSSSGNCEVTSRRCEVITADRSSADLYTMADPQREPLSMQFRYARFQAPLLSQFRVAGAAGCADGRPVEVAPSTESSDTTPSTSPNTPGTPPTTPTTPTNPTTPTVP